MFKDVLFSEWKLGYVFSWGRGFVFDSTGGEKLWIQSRLIIIDLNSRDTLNKESQIASDSLVIQTNL